ncbi:hypothetical protein CONPUDRAFT_75595 [Coniophora puteana RWD-64-598 SS2]|uniref:Uncharacterized protein n=1 Tax=Coniophora puteana (strain RWD-64-598) TaxID=741705 RepID=A0A5M3MF06_CONPW|nr:uncharacterized protein CONPUDRAFT_75595 [Coniophora puteana RWD-64-598 SS2]EIW77802.1 hypothetical protein CONPUDRAFT_75595 [Coniophora puteana RWD-64-598 SS2]
MARGYKVHLLYRQDGPHQWQHRPLKNEIEGGLNGLAVRFIHNKPWGSGTLFCNSHSSPMPPKREPTKQTDFAAAGSELAACMSAQPASGTSAHSKTNPAPQEDNLFDFEMDAAFGLDEPAGEGEDGGRSTGGATPVLLEDPSQNNQAPATNDDDFNFEVPGLGDDDILAPRRDTALAGTGDHPDITFFRGTDIVITGHLDGVPTRSRMPTYGWSGCSLRCLRIADQDCPGSVKEPGPRESRRLTMTLSWEPRTSGEVSWVWHPGTIPRPPVFDDMVPAGMTANSYCNFVLTQMMQQPDDSMTTFLLNLFVAHLATKLMALHPETPEAGVGHMISTLENGKDVFWSIYPEFFKEMYGSWPPATLGDAIKIAETLMAYDQTKLWKQE